MPGVRLGVAMNEGGIRVEMMPWGVADATLHTVRVDLVDDRTRVPRADVQRLIV